MCYFKTSELFDCIDELLKLRLEEDHFKICLQCNSKASVRLRTCNVCKGKLVRLEVYIEKSQQEKVFLYSYFKVKETSKALKIKLGEPDILNPNIFENLSVFLRSLGQRTKISQYFLLISQAESRKWWGYGGDEKNDGDILNPVLKLIFNVYHCLDCNEAIYRQANFESNLFNGAVHGNKSTGWDLIGFFHKQVYFILKRMLQNVLLLQPFMKEICMYLGFFSENAQM